MRSLKDHFNRFERFFGRREMVPGLANWRRSLPPVLRRV